jgi:hypothetical protein
MLKVAVRPEPMLKVAVRPEPMLKVAVRPEPMLKVAPTYRLTTQGQGRARTAWGTWVSVALVIIINIKTLKADVAPLAAAGPAVWHAFQIVWGMVR